MILVLQSERLQYEELRVLAITNRTWLAFALGCPTDASHHGLSAMSVLIALCSVLTSVDLNAGHHVHGLRGSCDIGQPRCHRQALSHDEHLASSR
jgi:hypothetical protein